MVLLISYLDIPNWPSVFVPFAAIYVGVTVCPSVVSVFTSHCLDLVALWGALARCPLDMFLPSGLVGQDTLACGANQARVHKPTILPRATALRVVVIADFSMAYTNPAPTLEVCLPASDITSGELVVGYFRVAKEGTETAQVSYAAIQRPHICFLPGKRRTKQTIVSDPQSSLTFCCWISVAAQAENDQ